LLANKKSFVVLWYAPGPGLGSVDLNFGSLRLPQITIPFLVFRVVGIVYEPGPGPSFFVPLLGGFGGLGPNEIAQWLFRTKSSFGLYCPAQGTDCFSRIIGSWLTAPFKLNEGAVDRLNLSFTL
jgi:hypothetical protein